MPQGAQKLGWLFRDVPRKARGPDVCTSTETSNWVWATPEMGHIHDKAAPGSEP